MNILNRVESRISVGVYVALICIAFMFVGEAQAYETTKQSAVRLNDDTVLYSVTYKFGFLNRQMRMPILAERTSDSKASSDRVEYALVDEGGAPYSIGTSRAIVLSDAEIQDNQYFLDEGENAEFTLVTLLHLPQSVVASQGLTTSNFMALQMTWLPFTLINDEGEESLSRVLPEELAEYLTPQLPLSVYPAQTIQLTPTTSLK